MLLGCAMFLGACNKENVVETPTTLVAMNYKIQPTTLEPQLHSLLLDIHPGRNQNGGLRKSQSTSILFRWPTFRTLASHYPRTEQPACMFTRCGEYLAENFTRPCKRYCMGWYHAKSQPLL